MTTSTDTIVKPKIATNPNVTEPSLYNVIYMNDDQTSMEFVIESLVEHFNYAAAAPLTSNGWNKHSGTTNPILVSSAGLNFSGYVGSGVGNAALVNNTGEDYVLLYDTKTIINKHK